MGPDSPDDGIVVGGDVDQVNVSLRVAAPDLDPAVVTHLFGVSPTFAARKGDRRPSSGGEVTQRTGIWILALAKSPEWQLGDAIDALLDRLPSEIAVWKRLPANAVIDMFCGLHLDEWNRGLELNPPLLQRLAERGITLSLDIYCNDSSPEADA